MSELDTVLTDLKWMRENATKMEQSLLEIFERLRAIEQDVAQMKADQKPPISGWTVFGIVVSVVVAAIAILDRIYVNQ